MINFTINVKQNEIWKPVEGYEGLYKVSNLGRIKHLKRVKRNNQDTFADKEFILSTTLARGYPQVQLVNESGIRRFVKVHRIVATAFIENPNKFPCVNHKDENKENNNVENLEWCDRSYNNTYNNRATKVGIKNRKAIDVYSVEKGIVTFIETIPRVTDIKLKYHVSNHILYKYVNTDRVYRQRATNKCFIFEYHD